MTKFDMKNFMMVKKALESIDIPGGQRSVVLNDYLKQLSGVDALEIAGLHTDRYGLDHSDPTEYQGAGVRCLREVLTTLDRTLEACINKVHDEYHRTHDERYVDVFVWLCTGAGNIYTALSMLPKRHSRKRNRRNRRRHWRRLPEAQR